MGLGVLFIDNFVEAGGGQMYIGVESFVAYSSVPHPWCSIFLFVTFYQ